MVASPAGYGAQSMTTKFVLHHSDWRDFFAGLETGSVDVLCADPPYSGMNQMLQTQGRIIGKYRDKENGEWFSEIVDDPAVYRAMLGEMKRVLNPQTGHVYIMFDPYSLISLAPLVREFFAVKNLITWDKVNIGMGHYYRRRTEFVLFATGGNNRKVSRGNYGQRTQMVLFATAGNNRKVRNRKIPDVWRIKRLGKLFYETQKPTELFEAMLFASGFPGALVCDPFVGSGASAVAATKMGLDFVGGDASSKAISMTTERVMHYRKHGVDLYQKPRASTPDDFWRSE
jgi:site-specific DNA-methyltransferase (adenine-specific)